MKTVWVIGHEKRGEPLFSLLKHYDYHIYFLGSTEESFFVSTLSNCEDPDFIIFNGEDSQLDFILGSLATWFQRELLPPLLLLSPISPERLLSIEGKDVFLERGIEVSVLVFLNKKVEEKPGGMVLGISHAKGMRVLRRYIRDLHIPLLVTGLNEALILQYLYDQWREEWGEFLGELNKYCHSYCCDGLTVLRGLGLDSQIGQWNPLSFPSIDNWIHSFLFRWINGNGQKGGRVTIWGNPHESLIQFFSEKFKVKIYDPKQDKEEAGLRWETVNGADLLIILSEDSQSSQIRVAEWAENRHRFRRPQVMDGMNLYEPEELKAVGYDYLSMFRYRYNFLRNREG